MGYNIVHDNGSIFIYLAVVGSDICESQENSRL